ncbi:MAG: acyl-CoA dehydrogenase family protein, partial [Holophagales bacterium]|nr:acyl-CoA dehydrogenase family protein [Holophagales bacterium]
MRFDWNDEQADLRRAAVDFASARLVEGAGSRDRAREFSREHWLACAEFGLQGVLVPEPWGGGGHDLLSAVAVFEGIGYGGRDNGLVFSVAAHAASCVGPLVEFGNEVQKEAWLPRLADGSAIGATGITEPDSGSNALASATTAERDGEGWVLQGSKTFVTNAPVADLFLVYARSGGEGFAGLTCFLVPGDTEGLIVGPAMEKMGLTTSPIAQIFLDRCRLPDSAVVG